jgi:hypothetical protein
MTRNQFRPPISCQVRDIWPGGVEVGVLTATGRYERVFAAILDSVELPRVRLVPPCSPAVASAVRFCALSAWRARVPAGGIDEWQTAGR